MATKQNRPHVVIKIAQTLDGKIATRNAHSQWITSPKTRAFSRRKRDTFDAICVGINTVLADDPRLTAVRKKNLKKVILDTSLKTPLNATLFKNGGHANTIIFTSNKSRRTKINVLRAKGVNVIITPSCGRRLNIVSVMRKLKLLGIKKLLIEGGAAVTGSALKAGLVDQVHIYIAPKILGDEKGRDAVVGLSPLNIEKTTQLKNIKTKRIVKDLFIQADVYRNR